MSLAAFTLLLTLGAPEAPAPAPSPPPPTKSLFEPDDEPGLPPALRYAKWAALADGGWSLLMTAAWVASSRGWDAPQPQGLVGVLAARLLYGTSFSVLIGLEVALLRSIFGEDFDGLGGGRHRHHWMAGYQIPGGCPDTPDWGCGFGLGGYSELSVRLERAPFPLELALTGGWLQGHHGTDPRRTLMESTWVVAPLIARARLPVSLGPARLEAVFGPGIYAGLHAAHVHPTKAGAQSLQVPLHEMIVLQGGAGLGLHAKLSLELFGALWLEAEADLAPFLLGGTQQNLPEVVQVLGPFDPGRRLWWRRASVGLGLSREVLEPLRIGVRHFAAELSERPLPQAGHRAWLVEIEVPLEGRQRHRRRDLRRGFGRSRQPERRSWRRTAPLRGRADRGRRPPAGSWSARGSRGRRGCRSA